MSKGYWLPYNAEEQAWLSANRAMPISDYHQGFCKTFAREDVKKSNLNSLRKRRGWLTNRTGRFEKGAVPINKGMVCAPGTGGRHPNAQRTQFKQGGLPANTKHAGHERVSKDGYVEISVEERNPHTGFERRYVHKHRWLWEQRHGAIPAGMVLKCLGEKADPDPRNWELMSRAMLPRLNGRNGRGYDKAPPELRPAILAVAKLEQSVRARRK